MPSQMGQVTGWTGGKVQVRRDDVASLLFLSLSVLAAVGGDALPSPGQLSQFASARPSHIFVVNLQSAAVGRGAGRGAITWCGAATRDAPAADSPASPSLPTRRRRCAVLLPASLTPSPLPLCARGATALSPLPVVPLLVRELLPAVPPFRHHGEKEGRR